MAKKTYSLDFGGSTSGTCTLGGTSGVGPDSTASSLQDGFLNVLSIGGSNQWTVTGTGPLLIQQAENLGNGYDLTFDPGDLDGSPSFSVVQQWIPSVNLSVDDSDILEPSGVATVTFGIAAVHTNSITIAFTVGGTASNPADYTESTTSPVVIASGESTASLAIAVVDDFVSEANETIVITLGAITGGEAGTASTLTITIGDNDYIATAGKHFMLMGVG